MNTCPSCGERNSDGAVICRLCSEKLVGPPRKNWDNLTIAEKMDQRFVDDIANQQANDAAADRYHINKRKSHAITGILTFFLIRLFLGMPYSLTTTGLVFNAISSTIIGYPLGYLISWAGGGKGMGALISGGAFALITLLSLIPEILFGDEGNAGFSLVFLVAMFGAGAIPGIYIGAHVDLDQ